MEEEEEEEEGHPHTTTTTLLQLFPLDSQREKEKEERGWGPLPSLLFLLPNIGLLRRKGIPPSLPSSSLSGRKGRRDTLTLFFVGGEGGGIGIGRRIRDVLDAK